MKKVKLIKSFAGYPEWEYILEGNHYAMRIFAQQEFIHKDIVQWMKDHFEEVKERPTSWEELWNISWCYIDLDCDIEFANGRIVKDEYANTFKTKKQAEASIALAQITQILDRYYIPEKSTEWYYSDQGWKQRSYLNSEGAFQKWLLRFDTLEKYNHFYKHHWELAKKLAPFYIF